MTEIMQFTPLKKDDWLFYNNEAKKELRNLEVLKLEFEDRIKIIDNTIWRELTEVEYRKLYEERKKLYNVIKNEVSNIKKRLEFIFSLNEKMTPHEIEYYHNAKNHISTRFKFYMIM